MTRNKLSTLTNSELLLAFTNLDDPTDMEVVLAERLEAVIHELENYESTAPVKIRYAGEAA